ncbi:MAG: hypothetical protein GY866_09770 [Proteobacteria bacterium]|nr:hypothetical protein [Pseudomonadota bacterium]
MNTKFQSYYCYLNNGSPIVSEKEPDNFTKLPFNYTTHCPNPIIAKMAYETNLKIMKWQLAEQW